MKAIFGGFLILVAATAAAADEPPTRVAERVGEPAQLDEIVHGFFLEGNGGYWATIRPPTLTPGQGAPFSNGQGLTIAAGWDFNDLFSASLFFFYNANSMGSNYTGLSRTGLISGSYESLIPGAAFKIRFVGVKDSQGLKRTFFYVRVGAGVVFYRPKELLDKLDVMVTGGLGVEYFTKLRHFSIGLEANFGYMALTNTMGFSVLPSVKYTF